MCADFQFYLNRQGAKGEKGDQGERGLNGNTPIPSTGINTPTEYTIVWDLGDGNTFQTGNLKQPTVDQGGTTLRYDRANDQIILGEPDLANTTNMTPGIVYIADESRINNEDVQDDDAVAYKVFSDQSDYLQEQITELGHDLDDLEGTVSQNSEDIESLDLRLDDEEANMLIVQGDITNLNDTKASKAELSSGLATKANVVHNHIMSQITDAGTLAKKNSVDYDTEVTNKPTIGNGTISIYQNGTLAGSFTTNQTGNSTINLSGGGGGGSTYAPGDGIDITSDVISAKVDGTTINFDASGNLECIVTPGDTLPSQTGNSGKFLTTDGANTSWATVSSGGSAVLKKTITQASVNVSELSNVITVTDADVTTSTLVTLYPSDITTETFLAEHLASNIITEGSGSFTFTLDTTLPATYSMYYIIQEIS